MIEAGLKDLLKWTISTLGWGLQTSTRGFNRPVIYQSLSSEKPSSPRLGSSSETSSA